MKQFLTAIVLGVIYAGAYAAPFGLNFGDSYAQLAKLGLTKDKSSQWYVAKNVPRPHPDFGTYQLLISPRYGLCKIIAANARIYSDSFGTGLRQQFDILERSLTRKYGEGNRFDHLKSGSIWNEPRDFMMGLVKDERTLATYWTSIDPDAHDGVASIGLRADATNNSTGVLFLNYESKNAKACIESSQDETNSAL